MTEAAESEVENWDFNWRKKEGIGGLKTEAQFSEYFSYDDNIAIKAGADLLNEIFFTCGAGTGLASTYRILEAVAVKCIDSRNPRPSTEESERPDSKFHRTFDVVCPDKLAASDGRSFLEKEGNHTSVVGSEFGTDRKEENEIVMASKLVLPLRLKEHDHGHGSVNSVLNVGDIYVVGSDARVNDTMILECGTKIKILTSDSDLKFKKVTKRVGITACGSQSRNNKLWKHLDDNSGDNIDDVAYILDKVEYFLHRNELPKDSLPLEIYVVGYSRISKRCEAYIIGDKTAKQPVVNQFDAVGGGGACALHRLMRFTLNADMPLERARRATLHALLYSTIRKVGVGGLLQVWAVTPNSVYELGKPGGEHAIDVMICLRHTFLDREIFVCDENEYREMNYFFLKECLQRYGVTPRTPACMGYIRKRWKLFLVRLENKGDVDILFSKGEVVGVRTRCRRITYTRNSSTVKMVVFKATPKNLYDLRNSMYLESLIL